MALGVLGSGRLTMMSFRTPSAAPFQVQVLFDRGQSYPTLRVEGMIRFYVVSREFEYNGATRQFFQMVGQVDLTGDLKSTESLNWGSVKALFR